MSAPPECCIAGTDGQPWLCGSAWVVALRPSSLGRVKRLAKTAAGSPQEETAADHAVTSGLRSDWEKPGRRWCALAARPGRQGSTRLPGWSWRGSVVHPESMCALGRMYSPAAASTIAVIGRRKARSSR